MRTTGLHRRFASLPQEPTQLHWGVEAWRGQPFPARKKESGLRHFAEDKEKIERSPRKAVALAKAPADVQNKHQAALIAL
ncbi:MAG: hypothetical protein ACTHKN_01430, partial [Achromobacter mucicolens]